MLEEGSHKFPEGLKIKKRLSGFEFISDKSTFFDYLDIKSLWTSSYSGLPKRLYSML